MPTGEYNTISIRNETYDRLIAAIHKAKKKNRRMYTSDFIDLLLDLYEKYDQRKIAS